MARLANRISLRAPCLWSIGLLYNQHAFTEPRFDAVAVCERAPSSIGNPLGVVPAFMLVVNDERHLEPIRAARHLRWSLEATASRKSSNE